MRAPERSRGPEGYNLKVDNLPANSLAFTNCVYVNDADFARIRSSPPNSLLSNEVVNLHGINVSVGDWVFTVRPNDKVAEGSVAFSGPQRQTAMLSLGTVVSLVPFIPSADVALQSLVLELQLITKGVKEMITIDVAELSSRVKAIFGNQVMTVGQMFAIDFAGRAYRVKVTSLKNVSLSTGATESAPSYMAIHRGLIMKNTDIDFTKTSDTPVKFTGKTGGQASQLFTPDFDFTKLGIGGLDKEFNDIFRRAFASRLYPASLVAQMGINHVRGMLLFGPPGCGKTLIARQIGKVLNAKEPKIVNGPEILNKYVGQSEENIRALFADAEKDYQELGEESDLHIIILDELDAITKQRGSSRDGTGVSDSIVNQFLSKIDGVNSLNNILIIGMTNRKDMIDEALLRPGRLEVHVEINLPDEKGRADILHIHTKRARENNLLSPEVLADIDSGLKGIFNPETPNLALRTKNFSGAEIEGLVRAAFSHAMVRGTDGKKFQVDPNYKPQLLLSDFDKALTEVKPKFGSPVDQLTRYYKNSIIPYGSTFTSLMNTLRTVIEQIRKSPRTPLLSVLLEGDPGAGKTALAAALAVESDFPLVRMISASDLVGYQESTKSNKIHSTFQEAYRSPLSIIIIDDMERILDYVRLGPRFSNTVLQSLLVMINRQPDIEGNRLLVIGITAVPVVMDELGLSKVFDMTLQVPMVQPPHEIRAVLGDGEYPISQGELDKLAHSMNQPIGIKKLLMVGEMARQDVETVNAARFLECLNKVGYDLAGY